MSTEYVSTVSTEVYKCSTPFAFRLYNERLWLNAAEQNKIRTYWDEALKRNDTLFNGDVLTVKDIYAADGKVVIDLFLTDYAHLTYIMNHKDETVTGCRSTAAGGLLITKDDYILLGRMGQKTSFPGIIQCIGGGISKEDITGEEAPVNTVIRECYEEAGIRVGKDMVRVSEKYIYVRERMSTLGFCYVVSLDLSKDEAVCIFDGRGDAEIEELICLKNKKEEIIKFCGQADTVDYLRPVLYDYAGINGMAHLSSDWLMKYYRRHKI